MEPEQIQSMREALTQTFGLEGTLSEQYFGFFQRIFTTGDFGPSLAMFPTPVSELIARALPWTFGLLLVATVIAWVLGNLIGLIAGYQPSKAYSRILESLAISVYPIPYYIFALALIILFIHLIPIFPLAFNVRGEPYSLQYYLSAIQNSVLPGASIVIAGLGWWVLSMKALSADLAEEDFVEFAKLKGVGSRRIMWTYVFRNALLPQITVLALQIGSIFNGALVMEILFGYPGLGALTNTAVLQADYNLLMGTISISIIAVATATLLIDLIYPLFDPRIQHR